MGQVLRPGDRVAFEDAEWTVTAAGSTVRLVDGAGASQVVLTSYLLSSPGFHLLSHPPPLAAPLEPLGLLGSLSEEVVEEARAWESHVLEVQTGLARGATLPRPEFDPTRTTLAAREQAKAAELSAAGQTTSVRTIRRMRTRYRDRGLWGHTRTSTAHGRVDERVVAATRAAIESQTTRSTGTKSRLWREVRNALTAEYGVDTVPLPSERTFRRLVEALVVLR